MDASSFRRTAGHKLVLGLDLGSSSLGIALIEHNAETSEGRIIHTASRIFAAGMTGSDKDWENGKEASNAAQRRLARGQRRQTDRRARRLRKVFHLLRSFGWMPDVPYLKRQDSLNQLDLEWAKKYSAHANLPYVLRARALDHALEPLEFGRAIYHLAQRRGFKSNRKVAPKADEDAGKVTTGIESIRSAIAEAGKRTLGEYFASLNPESQKVRRNWTHRDMLVQEFALIWATQASFNPAAFTPDKQDALFEAIFYQRPLKDQSMLVGECELVPGEKRAPMRLLEAQRYRYLSALNNLRLYTPERLEVAITQQQRDLIIESLELTEKLTFAQIKKQIGVGRNYTFSNEAGGEKQIPGNATAARIYAIIPALWTSLSPDKKNDLIEDLGDGGRYETNEDLYQALVSKWGLSEEEANKLTGVRMPDAYTSISLTAIRKLLPLLMQGAPFASAKHQVFPPKLDVPVLDKLPPVKDMLKEIRNPAVLRSLTELRKCVNAVLRTYGKPDEIHIELARDLRRSRKERMDMTKANRDAEKVRERAKAELILKGLTQPKSEDIEKFILWEECNHICPYTGSSISFEGLFTEPRFEIEHIIPYSRSLDNSRANKTLCHVDMNRRKGKRTPHEAFAASDDWESMVDRVKKFASPAKVKRFLMAESDTEKLLEDFTQRQLTDTKYASKLAQRYLASLFGGFSDSDGKLRIVSCAGSVTAILRRIWDMNRVLNEVPEKSRDDHRHHAVDAVAIALCNRKFIHAVSNAAAQSLSRRPVRSAMIGDPWPAFRDELRDQICNHTPVSHRPTRKLAGALHKETLYSRPHDSEGKEYVHVRKPVHDLTSENDIASIVDDAIREAVLHKWRENGGSGAKLEQDPPRMLSGVPIRKVRVRVAAKTTPIGSGPTVRNVVSGDNHHMEVLAVLNESGKVTGYSASVVSRLEANRRKLAGERIVRSDHGPNKRFLFSLSEGDMVEYARNQSQPRIYLVRGVTVQSGGMLDLTDAADAREKGVIKKDKGANLRPPANVFMRGGGKKILLDHIGNQVLRND